MSSVPATRGFQAGPSFFGEDGETVRAMRSLARKIRLDESLAWMAPEGEWRLTQNDIMGFTGRMSRNPTDDAAAVVTPIRHKFDLAEVAAALGVARNKLADWNWPMATKRLARAPGRVAPQVFGLAARRPGRRKAEAILTGWRHVHVFGGGADEGEAPRPELQYELHFDFIYASPEARGHLLGAALTSCAINQTHHDIASLREQISALEAAPPFSISVSGDAYSRKGLAALDDAHSAIEDFAGDLFEAEIECEPDYSL